MAQSTLPWLFATILCAACVAPAAGLQDSFDLDVDPLTIIEWAQFGFLSGGQASMTVSIVKEDATVAPSWVTFCSYEGLNDVSEALEP